MKRGNRYGKTDRLTDRAGGMMDPPLRFHPFAGVEDTSLPVSLSLRETGTETKAKTEIARQTDSHTDMEE